MISITYKMAQDSRFINNIKTGKRNRYTGVKDCDEH